jgi:tetratricopeptide (TPR) repeat protein
MCIQKAMACGSIHNLGRAFSMVGSILIVKGEFDKASEYLLKGIGELVKVRDYTNIAVSYNNLGDMSLRSGGYDMAIEYFGKCREFAEKVGKKFYVAVACINAGEAYARMGDLKRARVQEDDGLKLIERMGDPIGRMWVYKNYGFIYRLEKKWLEADIAFDTAQKILNGKNLPFEEAELLFERALMLRDKGEKDRAVEHLIMAQKLYSAAGAARTLNDVRKELDTLKGP